MPLKTTPLIREFHYNGQILPDPNPALSTDKVGEVFAVTYPELATASLKGPVNKEGKLVYEFERSFGDKG